MIHSSNSDCSSTIDHTASCSASLPRRSTEEPTYPATYCANKVPTDCNVRSIFGLSVGQSGWAGCRLTPNVQHAWRKVWDRYAFP